MYDCRPSSIYRGGRLSTVGPPGTWGFCVSRHPHDLCKSSSNFSLRPDREAAPWLVTGTTFRSFRNFPEVQSVSSGTLLTDHIEWTACRPAGRSALREMLVTVCQADLQSYCKSAWHTVTSSNTKCRAPRRAACSPPNRIGQQCPAADRFALRLLFVTVVPGTTVTPTS